MTLDDRVVSGIDDAAFVKEMTIKAGTMSGKKHQPLRVGKAQESLTEMKVTHPRALGPTWQLLSNSSGLLSAYVTYSCLTALPDDLGLCLCLPVGVSLESLHTYAMIPLDNAVDGCRIYSLSTLMIKHSWQDSRPQIHVMMMRLHGRKALWSGCSPPLPASVTFRCES